MEEWRSVLRAAVGSKDGAAVVAHLGQGLIPGDALQLAGDGLQIAVMQSVRGAADLASICLRALYDRGWRGDRELILELGAALGRTPAQVWAELRGPNQDEFVADIEQDLFAEIPVNFDDLADLLEGDPAQGGGRIDLQTGETWPDFLLADLGDDLPDDERFDDVSRWLFVDRRGSGDGYADMVEFADDIVDPALQVALERALKRRGPFRSFKDVLAREPGELERWFAFAEDRQRGRAREWLADQGYRAVPR